MCINSFAKRIGYMYKHRKLHRKNGITPLPEEIASETSKESACSQSSISSEEHSFKVQMDNVNICQCRGTEENISVVGCHQQDQENLPILNLDVPIELVPNSNAMTVTRYMREEKDPIQLPITCLQWPKMKQSSDATGGPSKSPKLSDLDRQKVDKERASEYSLSFDAAITPLPADFTSINDLCYFVLKSNGLIEELCQSRTSDEEYDVGVSMLCKKCRKSGNSLKMLICDLCGEAFHKHCCIPRKGKLPVDHWFCKSCSQSYPERVLIEKFRNREGSGVKPQKYMGHISSMLQGKEPYTTRARIGEDFQAEVPIWPHSDYKLLPGSPGESIELVDPAEYDSLDTYHSNSSNSTPMNNWLQCHETVLNSDGKEIECGKWRRAPASETQTENWDCSCALPWDSIHADCAVPQEVKTEVVLKELKLLDKVKARVYNKRKELG